MVRRVAMLSVHTSPLDQPGTGDAGGMNVYVAGLATALAAQGTCVEVFTRATSPRQPACVELADGVLVRHVPAGPLHGLGKDDLPGQLCAFTAGVLRWAAARRPGWFDAVHAHYWLSGQVGWLLAERWDVPLVHTMHTMAKVKNAALGPDDRPEPAGRVIGEEQVVAAADALVASTAEEATDLVDLYDADPDRVHVVAPGVDLEVFHPGTEATDARALAAAQAAARAELGVPRGEQVVLFAGRVQPLKGPDVLVRMLAELRRAGRCVPVLWVIGGPSGDPEALHRLARYAAELGVGDRVRFGPPVPQEQLARWFRAADLVAMPSRSESFGLVAAEAQACGTPVVATGVGGLRTAVADGVGGVLVRGHDPLLWADAVGGLLADAQRRAELAAGARRHALRMGWDAAAEAMAKVYALAAQCRGAGPEVPSASAAR
ncbi:D-inositol-3-phosphate glycosyltransferase [Isoptericola sp. b441]|uniref:D-inositol-3-phosphate glycosyltransferase n=1 Tax=Actinotalea lenta TaxID=3064654 RepID=A0ABT9D705_9CELL|nr:MULTISPECIES: D-inositol-3-phosphate glycosyltransferase [unclassified Isoptericola]MDO8106619.1 D-inositol-3-phosphate glycosyltransferase [Isoptericola sp. b441]MDO8121673.1 D-inositol-3-phosphate glycosyltransferase [Isoptericola sp. b490]